MPPASAVSLLCYFSGFTLFISSHLSSHQKLFDKCQLSYLLQYPSPHPHSSIGKNLAKMILSALARAGQIRPFLSLWVRESHCSTDLPWIQVGLQSVLEQSWPELDTILLCVKTTQKMLMSLKMLVHPAAQGRTPILELNFSWPV